MPREAQIKTEEDFLIRKNYRKIIELFESVGHSALYPDQLRYILLKEKPTALYLQLKGLQKLYYESKALSLDEIRERRGEKGFLWNITDGEPTIRQQLNNILRTMMGENKGNITVLKKDELGRYCLSDDFKERIPRLKERIHVLLNDYHINGIVEWIKSYPLADMSWKILTAEPLSLLPGDIKGKKDAEIRKDAEMLVNVTGGVRKGLTYTVFGMKNIPDIDDKIKELSNILAEKGKKKGKRLSDNLITVVITIPTRSP